MKKMWKFSSWKTVETGFWSGICYLPTCQTFGKILLENQLTVTVDWKFYS